MKYENMQIKDLPEGLLDKSWQQILPYSVGLLGIIREDRGERAHLIGSGTFVRVDDLPGILTAHHVVTSRRWKEAELLGLCFLGDVHRPAIDMRYLRVIEIAKPLSPAKGPDLAAVVLPPADFVWLREKRLFWDISRQREGVLANPLDKDIGVWFVLLYLKLL